MSSESAKRSVESAISPVTASATNMEPIIANSQISTPLCEASSTPTSSHPQPAVTQWSPGVAETATGGTLITAHITI